MINDYSMDFYKQRGALVNAQGVSYNDFAQTLKPKFPQVYRDIALGYVSLALTLIIAQSLSGAGWGFIIPVILGAGFIGYWMAYLNLFMHEAAHFNIAPSRKYNDLLANILICWFIGTSIQEYRMLHFQHHKHLGTTADTEHSYFDHPGPIYMLKTLTGIRALEVLMNRKQFSDAQKQKKSKERLFWLGFGVGIHFLLLAILLLSGSFTAIAAWVFGITLFFPFFGALRQVLEHRSEEADKNINYKEHDHGALTRIFGNDFFSRTFGGAGFNKHLLHHWQPQISYTNFPELEAYLMDTSMRDVLQQRQSTYWGVFRALISPNR